MAQLKETSVVQLALSLVEEIKQFRVHLKLLEQIKFALDII
jgi:hypothetical protein